jgi:hypothetical protein
VSDSGGENPVWNPRGGELFYAESPGPTQRMMSVRIDESGPGTPRPLFETEPGLSFGCRTDPPVPCYAVSPHGDRFYTFRTKPAPPLAPVTHVNVVLNWTEELKARVRPTQGR